MTPAKTWASSVRPGTVSSSLRMRSNHLAEATAMTTRYRLDPEHSRFAVHAFSAGLLSFLGHSPTFAIRDFSGAVSFADDLVAKLQLELTVSAQSLAVADGVKPADRWEIEDRMRAEVLEVRAFPAVLFRASAIATERLAPGHYRVKLDGTLSLHGIARPQRVDAE